MEEKKLFAQFKNGVDQIRSIRMTALEKKRVLENVINSPSVIPVKSPYSVLSFMSNLPRGSMIYVLPCLLILLTSGAAFASQSSLPGDALYSLKVRVIEPAHSSFIRSPRSKAQFESGLAIKRLTEAKTLAKQNKLDALKEKKLSVLLESHTTALSAAIEEYQEEESTEEKENNEMITDIQATLNAHASVIDLISERSDGAADPSLEGSNISTTARVSAEKIGESLKETEDTSGEDYTKKKEAIESLIQKTATEIDKEIVVEEGKSLGLKTTILNNTYNTLEEARTLLKEGEESDKSGNKENAYGSLLNSEVSAKEAELFLEMSLELSEEEED